MPTKKEPKKRSSSTVRRSTADAYASIVRRRKIVRPVRQDVRGPRAVALAGVPVVGTLVVVATSEVVRAAAKVPVAIDRPPLQRRATEIETAHLGLADAHVAPAAMVDGEILAATTGAVAIATAETVVAAAQAKARAAAAVVAEAVVAAVVARITTTVPPAAASTTSTTGSSSKARVASIRATPSL